MIDGERIRLRALEHEDGERIRTWRNQPELMGYHFSHMPLSEMEQQRWISNYDGSRMHVFIIENESRQPIGYTILKDHDAKNANAEIGLFLDPSFQGKGYGHDAFSTLLRYCFHELNLHRVMLQVFAFNERAIAMYEKMGFVSEGRLRDVQFTQNAYQDVIIMSMLRTEFDSRT